MSFIARTTASAGTIFDGVAELGHDDGQAVFDALGDLIFLLVSVIQIDLGDVAENHVFDVGFDLIFGIVEFVIGFLDAVRKNEILDADGNCDGGVVFRFGHDRNVH